MIEFAKIYALYTSTLFYLVRRITALSLLLLALNQMILGESWHIVFSLFLLVCIAAIFFRYKIARLKPGQSVAANDGKNIYSSFTLQALGVYVSSSSGKQMASTLLKRKAIQFILQKADIIKTEVQLLDVTKEEISKAAFAIVKDAGGTYITTMDLFAAYLLVTEVQTKLLFTKNLKKEEFLHLLYWARVDFSSEEHPIAIRVRFTGEGIGQDWVSGWTLETKKYTTDFTSSAQTTKPVLIGRPNEYKNAIEALSKKEKNSIILVGESGTGKTTLAQVLALESLAGTLPGNLDHKRFFELMVGLLLAGAATQGELENRLTAIIDEISHAGDVILVIPEIQNILGGSSFNLNLSGALLPYLRQGLCIIGTTTTGEYKQFIEPLHNFTDVFTVIKLEEPDENKAVQMLLEKATSIERLERVSLTYKAITASVQFAKHYMKEKTLPGSAVTLLADTASSVVLQNRSIVEEEDVVKKIEETTHIAIGKPKEEEKTLLLHLEDKLHERVMGQEEAVSAIAQSLRRIRTGMSSQDKPISFLFLGPTGVGKTELAKSLAAIYFGGEDKMIRLDMSEYQSSDALKRLLGASPGEGGERGELTDKVRDHPFSLVLLDEFEKANPGILDIFLQVLDDGRLTDNKGKTVSFANTIIVATSNAASEFIREHVEKNNGFGVGFQQKLLEFLQTNNLFKPELLNRFDAIVMFKPLEDKEVVGIVTFMLAAFSKELLKQDITVTFNSVVIEKIAKEGFDKQFGARPLRRFIQNTIEDVIAQKMLKNEIKRGNTVAFSVDPENKLTLTVSG